MITFKQVTDRLVDYNAKQILKIHIESLYKGIKFLSYEDKNLLKDFIYIGTTGELSCLNYEYNGCALLLIDNSKINMQSLNTNTVIFPVEVDIHRLFNEVQSLFYSENILQSNSASMLSLLTSGTNIQDIVHKASDMLNNPVLLPDSSGRLITLSCDKNIYDRELNDLMTYGYVSEKFVRDMQFYKMDVKINENEDPILFDSGPFKDIRRIVKKIKIKKRTVAFFLVLEVGRQFQNEDFETIRMICDVISLNMSMKQSFLSYTGDFYENLMIDLLTENKTTVNIKNPTDTQKFNPIGDYSVIVTTAPASCGDSYLYLEYLQTRIKNMLPECKSVYYDKHLVILLNTNNYEKKTWIISVIKDLIYHEELSIGLSRSFTNILNIQKYYYQAVKAIELGKLLGFEQSSYKYEDYYIYDLFSLVESKDVLNNYCHQSLGILIQYDMSNGTDYFDTLHEYLKHAMNKTETANILYVHRNTMDHRIRKITNLTKIDLSNGEECFKIFLSYKIYEFVNKNDY